MFWKKKHKLTGIVAVDEDNWGMGIDNNLPWHNKEDMKWFRKTTIGNGNSVLICGGNTYRSMEMKPLKNRHMIVVSKKIIDEIKTLDYNSTDISVSSKKMLEIVAPHANFSEFRFSIEVRQIGSTKDRLVHVILKNEDNYEYHFVDDIRGVEIVLDQMKKIDGKFVIGGKSIYDHFMTKRNRTFIEKFFITKMSFKQDSKKIERPYDVFFNRELLTKEFSYIKIYSRLADSVYVELWKK